MLALGRIRRGTQGEEQPSAGVRTGKVEASGTREAQPFFFSWIHLKGEKGHDMGSWSCRLPNFGFLRVCVTPRRAPPRGLPRLGNASQCFLWASQPLREARGAGLRSRLFSEKLACLPLRCRADG